MSTSDYEALIAEARNSVLAGSGLLLELADAVEALMAERDAAIRSAAENRSTTLGHKVRQALRDEAQWKSEYNRMCTEHDAVVERHWNHTKECEAKLAAVTAERDNLRADLADIIAVGDAVHKQIVMKLSLPGPWRDATEAYRD